jgi:hypothetical protein
MATDTSPITRSSDELRFPPCPIRKIPQARIIKLTVPSENSPKIFQRISFFIRNLNTLWQNLPLEEVFSLGDPPAHKKGPNGIALPMGI